VVAGVGGIGDEGCTSQEVKVKVNSNSNINISRFIDWLENDKQLHRSEGFL
jgi:hypothetical protein